MKKITLFLILTLGFVLNNNAQLQNSNWYFGYNAGLNYNDNSIPTVLTDGVLNAANGAASVSDSSGNLLFYTDGVNVYNKNHIIMLNGEEVSFVSSSSSMLIVPVPGNPDRYYIFFTEILTSLGNGLTYATVDMSGDGGLGEVIEKNVSLLPNTSQKMAVSQSSDGSYYWLVAFAPSTITTKSDTFYSYKIDGNGINLISETTFPFPDPTFTKEGQMKISPDNANIAIIHHVDSDSGQYIDGVSSSISENLHIFDFDEVTGIVSNMNSSYGFQEPYYYGLEFSPDSNLLYVSEVMNNFGFTGKIYQIQYKEPLPETTKFTVHDNKGSSGIYGLQRAIDGKIYVVTDSLNLGIINSPNTIGKSNGFVNNAIDLGSYGVAATKGLPQLVPEKITIVTDPPVTKAAPVILGNPIKDDLKIKFHDIDLYTIEIYNSVSTTIDTPEPLKTIIYEDMKNKKVYHVDVADLPKDTYYLIIRDGNQQIWYESVIKIEE